MIIGNFVDRANFIFKGALNQQAVVSRLLAAVCVAIIISLSTGGPTIAAGINNADSPISIQFPNHWRQFPNKALDVVYGTANGNMQIGLKFTNTGSVARDTQALFADLESSIGRFQPQGPAKKISVNGMPAEVRDYKGATNGKALDLGLMLIYPGNNRVVILVSIGLSDIIDQYTDSVRGIISSIRRR
jgi:hypothetical protein